MNKKCNHVSFWDIYKVINFHKSFPGKSWREYDCTKCWKKCTLKWKWYKKMKKNPFIQFFTYFLWILPAIILIALVVYWALNYMTAIFIVSLYHFWAMYYIINSNRLKIKEK